MAEGVRSVLIAAILLCLASDTDSAVQRVNVPGSFEFIDDGTCDTNIPRQKFIDQLAASIEGIDASYVSITSVKCAANLMVEWAIMMKPGVGPSNQEVIDRLRGFRDSDDARWIMFKNLTAAGFKAESVDVSMAMWKCTESMDCTSLTGWTGTNYVYLTLGVNNTDPTPIPTTTPPPKFVCPLAMVWLLEDLADDIPCNAQLGITFGGIAIIVIGCPLCCFVCRHRERRLLKNLCSMMEPHHLGTGAEAHRAYWWTALALTAEDINIKGIPTPDADSKITHEQIHLLLKERQMSETPETNEEEALRLLLRSLAEQGYITTVDPSLPKEEVRESNEDNPTEKATTLYERAVVQKGALAWDKSLIPAYGTPFYEDGTEVEFYSIRNVCWLLGTIRIFAAEVRPRGQDAEAGLAEKKIVYGIELQLYEHKESNEEAPPQWRYNIGLEQLRLPIPQDEVVEVCGPDGIWIAAVVAGPRLVYRVDLGSNSFRQQLAYCARATNSGKIMKAVPAERVRRHYTDHSDGTADGVTHVDYYESARSGWMPARLIEGIMLDEGNDDRDRMLQPWQMYGTHSNSRASSRQSEKMHRATAFANRENCNPDGTLVSAKSNTASSSWHIAASHATAGVFGTAPKQNSNRQSIQADSTNILADSPLQVGEEARVNIWTHAQIKLDNDRHEASLGVAVSTCRLRTTMLGRRNHHWV